jgi:hypothetical protein
VDRAVDCAAGQVVRRRTALTLAGCLAAAGAVAALRPRTTGVRLLFTGDILLSRQVLVELDRTGRSPWDSVAKLFAAADWVGGNFEGAIGHDSACRVALDAPCFAAPDTAARLLAAADFDAVTTENNHAGDLGSGGRIATAAALRSAGILGIDFERSPRFMRVGDLTVALVAVSTVRTADGQVQTIPSTELAQKLRLARTLANVVVVSVHWGTELQDWPTDDQRAAAVWLVDHGADLVVGHHPHVVQRPDCIHGRPVFFSLGNHVFDQKYPETKEGLIADCTIRGGRLSCGAVRTHARRGSAMPTVADLADSSARAAIGACTPALRSPLAFAGYEIRPQPWRASNDDGIVLEGWKDGAVRWRTRRARLVSVEPGLATGAHSTSLFTLERHPSAMDGEVALRPHVYDVGDGGLVARWRGTALAWPLLDATVAAGGDVCALHRGDSFVEPDPGVTTTRTMRYRWNGFGFSASTDSSGECARLMRR